ncbi:hypothetical protein LIER_33596 [Lithospermum erythrorhizon]|uniref:Purple acid phosphatase Fn3-like domain-containing protein n=1 Tax=Lithospermum erythrorhizon TaxID=34254 RepID=A0AAV3RYW8_LITER
MIGMGWIPHCQRIFTIKSVLGCFGKHKTTEMHTKIAKLPDKGAAFPLRSGAQYVRNDPGYLNCSKKECQKYDNGTCIVSTCGGSLSFHVINIRTDIEFAFFAAGFETPCLLKRSSSIEFSNPRKPLYGHLSSTDSSGTSMRLTWVSGDEAPQQVQFGGGKSVTSEVTTFSQNDMCSKLPSKSSYK